MPLPPLVEPVDALDADERVRTARHSALSGFGEVAQRRLAAAHVAVVGAGGLGSPTVLALAAAGIGALTVIDADGVEASNLQRQVMHRVADVGRPKVDSAVRVAADLSPRTVVHAIRARLTRENARDLLSGAHVVVDGTDTFETRDAVAAACEDLGVPLVWGVVQEFHAQATVFWSSPPAGTAPVRLSDLYPPETVGDVPTCEQVGVLGPLCLQVGAILATETVKLLTGVGEPLLGRVLVIDALRGRTDEVLLQGAAAPTTAETATRGPVPEPTAVPTHPLPTHPDPIAHLDLDAALAAQAGGATLLDVREPHETAAGVLAGVTQVPLAALLADPALAGPGPVVVVCKVGVRAERAARALRAAGIEASVLAGGMDAWDAAPRVTVDA
ncbi:HesA/MoeB/ThiF family protein [Microbacterium sulfonylureivorans]|uniref:HesA/MoeB/ThiF family protein n=1 Tax=Microbacterium sulfonylureivorans TaxID=2486854 RepID=UPI000FD9533F|nr:ThiF family adenylyltransferase [Microbacterium sulfonylureivorans]